MSKIKLLEMDHAYWLAQANYYAGFPFTHDRRDELFTDALSRCQAIRGELEREYGLISAERAPSVEVLTITSDDVAESLEADGRRPMYIFDTQREEVVKARGMKFVIKGKRFGVPLTYEVAAEDEGFTHCVVVKGGKYSRLRGYWRYTAYAETA